MTADPCSILALLLTPGVGPAAVRRALAACEAVNLPLRTLLSMPWQEVVRILPPGLHTVAHALMRCSSAIQGRAHRLLERVREAGIQTISIVDEDYPRPLRDALRGNAPPLLFIAGHAALLDAPAAAVVGARNPSRRGEDLAAACAETLAREGAVIVSGGARGVDCTAHESALRDGGNTIVVLPQGILTYRGPALLFDAIQDGRAAVVSQFAPDMAWETHAAVTRNATISAFSLLVCVIEPKKTGGSVRTARCALAQGKRVLVYPARGCASVAQSLSNGGALELIEGRCPVGIDELANLWRTASVHLQEQKALL